MNIYPASEQEKYIIRPPKKKNSYVIKITRKMSIHGDRNVLFPIFSLLNTRFCVTNEYLSVSVNVEQDVHHVKEILPVHDGYLVL